MRKSNLALFLVIILLTVIMGAQPSEARRFHFVPIPHPGGTYASGEAIDHVRDMPFEPIFSTDGKHYDLGYLRSPKGDAYVLYHDDHFYRLNDAALAALTVKLGYDPTAADRMKRASAQRASSTSKVSGESSRATVHPLYWLLIVLALLWWLFRKALSGLFGLRRTVVPEKREANEAPLSTPDYAAFDARIAEHKARTGEGGMDDALPPTRGRPLPAPAGPHRGFGRKQA